MSKIGLIISWPSSKPWYDIAVGFLLSLSILFKLFGIFLIPLLARAVPKQPASVLRVAFGGLLPVLASFTMFGFYFVETMGARAARDSGGIAWHSSPWILLPWLDSGALFSIKLVTVALLGAGLVALLLRRRIDLLNFYAALCVIFACLWLQKGAANRMNIAIMFAMASLMSVSSWRFCAIVLVNAAVDTLGYALGIVMYLPQTTVDSVLTTFFWDRTP